MGQEPFNWRTFLGEIARDPQEKQRLAEAMGVNPITLTRWASSGARGRTEMEGEKLPRPQIHSLRKLVAALPAYREKLMASILQEFQEFTEEDFHLPVQKTVEEPSNIPVRCYEEILEAAATLPIEIRFPTILERLLTNAVRQIDPERLGLAVSMLICTPPLPGKKVRSLHEMLRMSTPPWSPEREERQIYRGAESLAGLAITTCRSYQIGNVPAYRGWLPVVRNEPYEVSLAVCPIQRAGNVAGCLRLSSTQGDYFSRERVRLIQKYAYLAVEAFDDSDYYPLQEIELRLMPEARAQEPFLHGFNKRVEEILARGEITNWEQAVQITLDAIESDLIALSSKQQKV